MEKINKQSLGSKKIFLRKEIEQERLGEEIYVEDILCQYSVYLVRKFEEKEDYLELSQMELLLMDLPERFNQDFKDAVVKNLYVRTTAKAVYVTLLLALPQPLSKFQITELKNWMGTLSVSPLALEHTSNFTSSVGDQDNGMVREWQETNSEVLLLTEMMNQFNESLTDVYTEIQSVKNQKTPPKMRVVKSEAAVKTVIEKENENSQRLDSAMAKVDKLNEAFEAFQKQVMEQLDSLKQGDMSPAESKTPPKFKIYFDGQREEGTKLEQRLNEVLKRVETLANRTDFSQKEIEKLGLKVDKEARRTREMYRTQSESVQPADEQSKLEAKMALTNKDIVTISSQLKEINKKLSTVEMKVSEAEQSPEELAQLEQDHDRLHETASETQKLNQVINQLTEKVQSVQSELTDVKQNKKKNPVMRLKKSEAQQKLSEQHRQDQEQLKANAVEIKKLSQTVGKVDVQLIQAHQKISELEQKLRTNEQLSSNRRRELESTMIYQQDGESGQQPAQPNFQQNQQSQQQIAQEFHHQPVQPVQSQQPAMPAVNNQQPQPNQNGRSGQTGAREFPSKADFLQASRPIPRPQQQQQAPMQHQQQHQQPVAMPNGEAPSTVTLSIEEMLNRVSDHPKQPSAVTPVNAMQNKTTPTSLRRLKKLESDITTCFKRVKGGIGSRGMIAKEDVYANIRQIEVLPYLWSMIYTGDNPQDIRLNNEISCQQLVKGVPQFLREVEEIASKRKVMGKWIYAPKELEQKMEGYKLLNEYFELYLSNTPS